MLKSLGLSGSVVKVYLQGPPIIRTLFLHYTSFLLSISAGSSGSSSSFAEMLLVPSCCLACTAAAAI